MSLRTVVKCVRFPFRQIYHWRGGLIPPILSAWTNWRGYPSTRRCVSVNPVYAARASRLVRFSAISPQGVPRTSYWQTFLSWCTQTSSRALRSPLSVSVAFWQSRPRSACSPVTRRKPLRKAHPGDRAEISRHASRQILRARGSVCCSCTLRLSRVSQSTTMPVSLRWDLAHVQAETPAVNPIMQSAFLSDTPP